MRIHHVIAVNGIGGAETLLLDLILQQSEIGNELKCLVFYKTEISKFKERVFEKKCESKCSFTYIKYKKVLSLKCINHIDSLIAKDQPHIIHTHLKQADLWLAVLKFQNKIYQPVVSTIHGYRDGYHNKYGLRCSFKIKFQPYYWLTKFICYQLDSFIAISKGISNLFLQAKLLPHNKIHVIYHGIDINGISEINNFPEPNSIVFFGRLVKFKGVDLALQSISILKDRYPNIKLHIYGNGPEEEKLKKITKLLSIESNVTFHGFVQDVFSNIRCCRLAIISSIGEPFGMVFLEAIKAALPIVAFNVPAGNEILEDGVSGLLASPFDVQELSHKISKILDSDELRNQIVAKGQERLEEKFNIKRMVNDYQKFYLKQIEDKKFKLLT